MYIVAKRIDSKLQPVGTGRIQLAANRGLVRKYHNHAIRATDGLVNPPCLMFLLLEKLAKVWLIHMCASSWLADSQNGLTRPAGTNPKKPSPRQP